MEEDTTKLKFKTEGFVRKCYMKTVLVYGMKNSIGGIENFLLNMQKYLGEEIHFAYLIEKSGSKFLHETRIIENGGEIIDLPDRHKRKAYIDCLRNVLKNYKQNTRIFYANISQLSFDFIPILVAINEGYQVITHTHGAGREPIRELQYRIRDDLFFEIGKRILKHANITRLAVSDRSASFIYSGKPYTIIPPGIEVAKYKFNEQKREELRNTLRLNDSIVLGFVGRIVPVKNPLFLLDILKEAKERDIHAKMLVLGDGELREEMGEKASSLGIQEDILFTGSVENVSDYLNAMDILLAPSFSEGMPLGIMEAQSNGLPSICAQGNFPESIDVTGMVYYCLLKEGPERWVELIKQIMDQSNDRLNANEVVDSSIINIHKSSKLLFHAISDCETH